MNDIRKIIDAIDVFLEENSQKTTNPVEINAYLETIGLLGDSNSRQGKPIRDILRNGQIPHAYQIGVNWKIPHSGKKKESKNSPRKVQEIKVPSLKTIKEKNHKLLPIGEMIVSILEKEFKIKTICYYEFSPNWLFIYPTIELLDKYPQINEIYNALTENKLDYKNEYLKLDYKKKTQKQSFDIWIGEPYNFAVEFDEKQHFNQFRLETFRFYSDMATKYSLELYKDLNKNCFTKPGNSGFTTLKSIDPFFPEMCKGINQDNRIRQRAFRDFLKDLLPVENGFSPTLRIPYHVTNKKTKDFDKSDLIRIKEYLIETTATKVFDYE